MFLPGGVLPPGADTWPGSPMPARTFTATLHRMPALVRAAARLTGKEMAARSVRGVLVVTLEQPSAVTASGIETASALPAPLFFKAFGLRAPPAG